VTNDEYLTRESTAHGTPGITKPMTISRGEMAWTCGDGTKDHLVLAGQLVLELAKE